MNITAQFHTLGCKLNYAETSQIASLLAERGISKAESCEEPDIVVINTCSVTSEADSKCRRLIRSVSRRHPQAAVVVTGCYAQLRPEDIASMQGVAIVAGNDRKGLLADYVDTWLANREKAVMVSRMQDMKSFSPACSRGDRTRYFLKVQDGCDYWCTYCTIPRARGRSRSGYIADIVSLAENVAHEGGKEIVITGVNIGDFGKGHPGEDFLKLIERLDRVDGIERYRISSIEPDLLTDDIIRMVATSEKFMPHFHIPLQAGTDEVLKLMHRHYDTALFRSRVEMIRSLIPDAFIGVDLIAGARGETPELFESSKAFVESLDISRLHVFPYSERPGTKALNIDYKVDQAEKHRRVGEMMKLSDSKLDSFSARYIGKTRPVLLEHQASPSAPMAGFTDNYLRVRLSEALPERAGEVVDVTLRSYDPKEQVFVADFIDNK